MAEKQNADGMYLLSRMMGEQGQDTFRMMERMKRLNRLLGTSEKQEIPQEGKKEEPQPFGRNERENMIFAAIPFLDREYQKGLYLVVRLMEMRRVLSEGALEARGRQEEEPALRRKKLLGAVRPYLSSEERNGLDTMVRVMSMKEWMEQEDKG